MKTTVLCIVKDQRVHHFIHYLLKAMLMDLWIVVYVYLGSQTCTRNGGYYFVFVWLHFAAQHANGIFLECFIICCPSCTCLLITYYVFSFNLFFNFLMKMLLLHHP
uniref:Uncharacterized protein n=1 Tax=Rhizophora mucronata TaxID=61149 RepID=A0A2P2MCT2_RHIMU